MQNGRPSQENDVRRPRTLHASQSFTRLEASHQHPIARSRATTVQEGAIPDMLYSQPAVLSPKSEQNAEKGDIFASQDDGDSVDGGYNDGHTPAIKLPETFDELPIEIRSLTERFLESLSARVHPTPLSVNALSELFQEFYARADSHIATHIATLSSRLSRDKSPTPSISSRASMSSKGGGRTGATGSRKESPSDTPDGGEQQMLTASQIADRRRARRVLELKRTALEEAVERAVCEKIYTKIWQHRSTDDEERDQKLRSRTAALSVVGIGLKELLANSSDIAADVLNETVEKEDEIRDWLAGARESLQQMDNEHYPLGKLQHLTAAHKNIVESLSKLFPASSSADEILPTLIYTLITSPPESISVISNINFIQRFRATNKIDGEAAYCLVNLEAAISFLETVDLSSLRADEAPNGPDKASSRPLTPQPDAVVTPTKLDVAPASKPGVSPVSVISTDIATAPTSKPLPSPSRPQRRFSNLIQAQTNKIEAASDSFRDAVLEGADQAFDTINSTLENSFKFLFGRLREQQVSGHNDVLPKTLEDARRLVSTSPPGEDDAASISATSSIAEPDEAPEEAGSKTDNKVLELIGGRRQIRDRSADSTKSGGSGKRVAFAESKASPSTNAAGRTTTTPPSHVHAGNAAVESMRNLGNTLNPLNSFARMGIFGRAASGTPPASTPTTEKNKELGAAPAEPAAADVVKDSRAVDALEQLRKTPPPIRRFVELKSAADMKIGEVDELLKDYQRLANALKQAVAP